VLSVEEASKVQYKKKKGEKVFFFNCPFILTVFNYFNFWANKTRWNSTQKFNNTAYFSYNQHLNQ